MAREPVPHERADPSVRVENVEQVTVEAAKQPIPSINMPDHELRQERWYQVYVRLGRPTLDWATIAWFVWCTMLEPITRGKFDSTAVPMCLLWCATVYGIKTLEKTKGVA